MKTLPKFLTAACLLSLASCTVYETPTASAPPPPPPPVYEPAPAPPPAPVYSGPVAGPAPAPAPAPVASGPAPAYTQPAPNYNQPAPGYNQPPQQGYNEPANGYNQPVTLQTFYDALSPYGQWVNYGGYGYVWIPNAGRDFTPYSTAGHWVYTDNGWMWASDYNWGWATFHYGRWDFDAVYGWMWIPDTQWGPAWVQWRSCDGYYGWAPLQPNYGWNNYNSYNPPADRWVFCQRQYITNNNVSAYYEPRDHYNDYIRRSNVIGRSYYDNDSHTTYAAGPDQNEVSRASGRNITPVHIAPASGPGASQIGNDGNIHVYRPSVVRPVANNSAQPAPQRVVAINQVQPVAQRTTTIRPEPMPERSHQPGNNGGTPQRIEPVQQQPAPQRTEPVQQQPAPQRSEPMQQQPAPQRTAPVQQQPAPQRPAPAQKQQPAPKQQKPNRNTNSKPQPITPKKDEAK